MNKLRMVLAVTLTLLTLAGKTSHQPEAGVIIRVVRSYRAEQGRTQVDAFVQVPLGLMEPTKEGSDGVLSYSVAVRVTDSTGLSLFQQSWHNHAPASLDRPEAFAVEIIHFSLTPGRYRLNMSVEDSMSHKRSSSAVDLEAFISTPVASDLILSPQIRPATGTDTVPRPAELRWGRMLVTAAAQLQLTPLRSDAYYLLEAYSAQDASGTLELRVADSTGKVVVRAAPAPVRVPPGGGVVDGRLDLAGLPPARYVMTAALKLGRDSVERSANFVMAALGETLARDVVRRESEEATDEGFFASLDAEALAEAEAPLGAIAESGELSAWDKSLSLAAKRNLLARFWSRHDPTPKTPRNEAREAFYGKVEFANRAYAQNGKDRAGWRSDRGRIYLQSGRPDEVLRRTAQGAGGRVQARALPYEVWHYTTSGKDRFYIFVDRTGSGAYALVHSNDLRQSRLANWNEFFGIDDIEDIQRFVGTDVLRDTRAY